MKEYNLRAREALSTQNQVGLVQKAFGASGELVIKLWDTFPEDLNAPLWVEIDALPVPLFVGSLQSQGTSKAVVVFDDFEDAPTAAMLIGKPIFSEHAQAGDDDEDAHPEQDMQMLLGFRLRDVTSSREGVVTGYIHSEFNPLLEAEFNERSYLLPLAEELIVKLNPRKRQLEMRFAEGIFDLDTVE